MEGGRARKPGEPRRLTARQLAKLPPEQRRDYCLDLKAPVWSVQKDPDGKGFTAVRTDDTVVLPGVVFDHPPRTDVMHKAVKFALARRRGPQRDGISGHVTKRKGDLAYSNRKMGPQKGSGKARHGDKKAPQFKGGAKAHGPVHRDFSIKMNTKERRVALAHALSARAREGRLVVFDNLAELCGDHPAKKYKTGPLRKMLNDLLINKLEAPRVSALLCDEGPEVEEPPPPPPLQFFAMREGALPPGPWVPARTGKRDKLPRKVLELAEAAGWKPEPPTKAGPKQGDRAHDGLYLAARNIPFVDVCPRAFMGCWWVIKHDFLLMDRRSLDGIVKQYLKIMKMRKK